MSSDRNTFTLDEVFDFRSGLSKPRSAFGTGYPFLTFKDVFYNFFVPKELGDLVQSSDAERVNGDIRRGDVFLTRTSETQHELGMSCVALSDVPNATFNGFTKRLRPKPHARIVPEYVGYFFRSSAFRDRVTAISTLSTRASLNEDMLGHLEIVLPERDVQISVGAILKSLDDKIDLLREMNRTLDDIARAVFRAWFVDFEPVHAKAAGAKSFRGMPQWLFDILPKTLERSESLEIPSGWRVDRLENLVSTPITRGLAPKYIASGGVLVLNQKCVRDWNVSFNLARRHDHVAKPAKGKVIERLDILVNSTGVGTLGRVAQVCSVGEVTTFDSHLSLVRPDSTKIEPLYLGYDLTERQHEIERLGHGSTGQTELSRQKLGELRVTVPQADAQVTFGNLISPLVERKEQNRQESETLLAIRDALLPKLISGELVAPSLKALGIEAVGDGE
ncbi:MULTISPECIES: restriction endonuclease subunit S [unclassified Bradyrhizobium]|uniref:restriction endonuclease subunit S n=1 Tax=unclassified Bradyrhizobium TaxID=2631580 RepID=UPI0028E48D16|nr:MULTISPECIES: restriction endonuclease subunit S [unclassified Bradyrhizobium]